MFKILTKQCLFFAPSSFALGASRNEILECVENNWTVLFFYNQYTKYLKTSSTNWVGVKQRDSGIILNILNLNSDMKCAEALAAITSQLHYALIMNKNNPHAYVSAVDCEGADIDLVEITAAWKETRKKADDECGGFLDKTLDILDKSLKQVSVDCPKFDAGHEKIAATFEVKIKMLCCDRVWTFYV
jgi:hypothetical protein